MNQLSSHLESDVLDINVTVLFLDSRNAQFKDCCKHCKRCKLLIPFSFYSSKVPFSSSCPHITMICFAGNDGVISLKQKTSKNNRPSEVRPHVFLTPGFKTHLSMPNRPHNAQPPTCGRHARRLHDSARIAPARCAWRDGDGAYHWDSARVGDSKFQTNTTKGMEHD